MRQSTPLQKTYPLTSGKSPRTELTLQSSPPVTRRRSAKPSAQYGEEAEYSYSEPPPRSQLRAERKRTLLPPNHTPLQLLLRRSGDGRGDKTRLGKETGLEESHHRPFQDSRRREGDGIRKDIEDRNQDNHPSLTHSLILTQRL